MKILIIEDDETKLEDIREVIGEIDGVAISGSCASYRSGLKALTASPVDVVILDMTLPLYDEGGAGGGGRKVQFGGELVLQEMEEEGMECRVIVVSQHDYFSDYVIEINLAQLGERLRERFGGRIIDTILYDSSEFSENVHDGWRKQLKSAINSCLGN